MKRSAGKSLEKALAIEAEALGELIVTPESKNLIHVFHLMEDAKKAGPDAEGRPVERVAVLGAGVMGGGIAQLLAYKDLGPPQGHRPGRPLHRAPPRPVHVRQAGEAAEAEGPGGRRTG
jgi:hypothetical protein